MNTPLNSIPVIVSIPCACGATLIFALPEGGQDTTIVCPCGAEYPIEDTRDPFAAEPGAALWDSKESAA
jgi:hypothetical protein